MLGLVALSLTTGCARYKITLTNGNVITTHSKPKYDPQQGVYRYKDAQGNPAFLPQFRIKEIEPL